MIKEVLANGRLTDRTPEARTHLGLADEPWPIDAGRHRGGVSKALGCRGVERSHHGRLASEQSQGLRRAYSVGRLSGPGDRGPPRLLGEALSTQVDVTGAVSGLKMRFCKPK